MCLFLLYNMYFMETKRIAIIANICCYPVNRRYISFILFLFFYSILTILSLHYIEPLHQLGSSTLWRSECNPHGALRCYIRRILV